MQGFLIAETDEDGKIEWVWVHRETDRTPKPLNRDTFPVSELGHFEVHGASSRAVKDWLSIDGTVTFRG